MTRREIANFFPPDILAFGEDFCGFEHLAFNFR